MCLPLWDWLTLLSWLTLMVRGQQVQQSWGEEGEGRGLGNANGGRR